MSNEGAGFVALVPLRDVDVEGVRLFTMPLSTTPNQEYPIVETYQRGPTVIDGESIYFSQTTFVVLNDTGERTYVPYNSGNFSKKRSVARESVVI